MMLRRVLQLATSKLGGNSKRFRAKNSKERIDSLAGRQLITHPMQEWSHQIRLDGNEAAHEEDEDFTKEQATQMKEFAELLLIYAFTLPERMRQAQAREKSKKQSE